MLFYCLFQYFEEKEYQTESKWNETFGNVIFWKIMILETWSSRQKILGPLEAPPTDFFRLYKPMYPKTIEYQDRLGVPPPQATVATKNLSRARSGTLPEGGSLTGGHIHHPGAIHDEEGVVHPRG